MSFFFVGPKLVQYADDSALLASKNNTYLSKELQEKSKLIVNLINKLSLHLGKTESILFGPTRKLKIAS